MTAAPFTIPQSLERTRLRIYLIQMLLDGAMLLAGFRAVGIIWDRLMAVIEVSGVDPNCQVFGMPGLFVAGAPTFPSGSFANPTLVGMALGQRLVSHLLKGTR